MEGKLNKVFRSRPRARSAATASVVVPLLRDYF